VWFRLEDLDYSTIDYCPILFSFFKEGIGGFESYFIGNQLYYRSLPAKYSAPGKNENIIFR
jgi:hypothetical protein